VEQGLATGDNHAYLFQNPEAHGNYRSIEDYREYLLTEDDLERIRSDETLRLSVIENGVSKDDLTSNRYFGGRYIAPYDKGGESDAEGGWIPNYWVSTDYFIDWSQSAVHGIRNDTIATVRARNGRPIPDDRPQYHTTIASALRNQQKYFIRGVTFSHTGNYSPTYRLGSASLFDMAGSTIFTEIDIIDVFELICLLSSKLIRYSFKTYTNTSVNASEDPLKLIQISINLDANLRPLLERVIANQKSNPRYDYASNEQLEIDRLVYEAYGLNEDDIREVENWYARRYPALAAAQRANLERKLAREQEAAS
jgi:hypothetical protein